LFRLARLRASLECFSRGEAPPNLSLEDVDRSRACFSLLRGPLGGFGEEIAQYREPLRFWRAWMGSCLAWISHFRVTLSLLLVPFVR
jgi:hypothetical protein